MLFSLKKLYKVSKFSLQGAWKLRDTHRKSLSKKCHKVLFILPTFWGLLLNAEWIDLKIERLEGVTHFEFFPSTSIDEYKIIKNGKQYSILLDGVSSQARESLKKWKGDLIEKVELIDHEIDNKTKIKLYFSRKDVEVFDYTTENPRRLILDFFISPQKKTTSVSTKENTRRRTKKRRPSSRGDAITVAKKKEKSPLWQENQGFWGISDGTDPLFLRFNSDSRWTRKQIDKRLNGSIYLPIPHIETPSTDLKKIQKWSPSYQINPKSGFENKQARFLLKLFQRERFFVFLKSLNLFRKEFPRSYYDELLYFMQADAHYSIWQQKGKEVYLNRAINTYQKALNLFPKTSLKQRTELLLGFSIMSRGDFLQAARRFQKFLRENPKSLYGNRVRLALGKSFLKTKKFKEASSIFNSMKSKEAYYRRGDVSFFKGDYGEATELYQQALKKFPQSSSLFPNAFYHQAEALFWQGHYRKALNLFKSFVIRFPLHENSGYALTRVGEILDILGEDSTKVMGAYLETYFRYGDLKSTEIARVRMLSQKMNSSKEIDLQDQLKELDLIVKESSLPKMKEFVDFMKAEGFSRRGQLSQAIETLNAYRGRRSSGLNKKLIRRKMKSYINLEMNKKIKNGQFLQALKGYDKYDKNWLSDAQDFETLFYRGKAYELAGSYKESQKKYKKLLNDSQPQWSQDQRNSLYLRLASVSNKLGHYQEASRLLQKINEKKVSLNSSSQVEKLILETDLLQKRGQVKLAQEKLKTVLKNWKGEKELLEQPAWNLALMLKFENKKKEVLKVLKLILNLESSQSIQKTREKALELYADTSLELGFLPQAVSSYEGFLQKYRESLSAPGVRYRLGEAYFKEGKLKKASEVWRELEPQRDRIWYELAQQKMKTESWDTSYQKYLKRIPAMKR